VDHCRGMNTPRPRQRRDALGYSFMFYRAGCIGFEKVPMSLYES
jgi:hypothetical protein